MKYLSIALIFFTLPFKVDIYDSYMYEAFTAYTVQANYTGESNIEQDKHEVKDCKCGGTGKVKTGDGINYTECPCGPNCSCKKNQATLNKRVLLFTDRQHCQPCKRFENQTVPNLTKKGANWKVGPETSNHIQVIDINNKDNGSLFEKYGVQEVPTFILIEDDKVLNTTSGFLTAKQFTDFFYGSGSSRKR